AENAQTLPVDLNFSSGKWTVKIGEETAGELPEFPDFPDAVAMIENNWRKSIDTGALKFQDDVPAETLAAIGVELDAYLPHHLFAAGRQINDAWKQYGPDARLVALAARLFVALTMQRVDSLEAYDQLPAKACALVAIAGSTGSEPLLSEKCLLAYEMGYTTAAMQFAAQLDESDPARLYVTRNDEQLSEIAHQDPPPPLARGLYMRRLAQLADSEGMAKYFEAALPREDRMTLAMWSAGLESNTFAAWRNNSSALPAMTVIALGQAVEAIPAWATLANDTRETSPESEALEKIMKAEPPRLVEKFDELSPGLVSKFEGPLVTSDDIGKYLESYFVSGLAKFGLFLSNMLGSQQAAAEFAASLDRCEGPMLQNLRRWYRGITESSHDPEASVDLLIAAAKLNWHGTAGFCEIENSVGQTYPYGKAHNLDAAVAVASRVDTRPEGLALMARVAAKLLYDPALRDHMYDNVIRLSSGGNDSLREWYLDSKNDRAGLDELVRSPKTPVYVKYRAVNDLARADGTTPDTLIAAYESLIQSQPDEWTMYDKLARYLRDLGRYDEAADVMNRWLNRKVDTAGLEENAARALLAKIYRLAGRLDDALATLQPVIDGQYGGVMEQHALLLAAMGKPVEAVDKAKALIERYPQSAFTYAVLSSIYLEQGRVDDAAKVLVSNASSFGANAWKDDIWPEF
ncbi:MAG: tetratricopeptide repeat protein, partial [Candidatus Hydrogenedentota bacterium]